MRGLELAESCQGADRQTDKQTDEQTDGYGNSMTESAQWGLFSENKPAKQAAGADPSRCNSTLGKIPLFTKIAATFDLMKRFRFPSRFRLS